MVNQSVKTEKKAQKSIEQPCPVGKAMEIIRGKWSFLIIKALLKGTLRFKELEREVFAISTRMLVKELKALEVNGLITRKAYATVPPTVEYSLTTKGKALQPVFNEIENWTKKFL